MAARPVPIPFSARWRDFRTRQLPIVVWIAAALGAVFIAGRQHGTRTILPAIVQTREAMIASPEHGVVTSLMVALHQEVRRGDVIAVMDDRALLADVQAIRAELARRSADLATARLGILWEDAQLERDRLQTLRRLALDAEQARLDVLDREANLQVLNVQLEGLTARLVRLDRMLEQGVVDPAEHDLVTYEKKAIEARIREETGALASARALSDNATARRAELEEALGAQAREIDEWLEPWREVIAAQESLLSAQEERRERLVLRAPTDGRITFLAASAGETVLAGIPIATVTASAGIRIVAYAAESQLDFIAPGAEIEIQTRRSPRQVIRTRIESTSSRIEELPPRLWPHPMMPQYGMPLLVEETPGVSFVPGEVLQVRVLRTAESETGTGG